MTKPAARSISSNLCHHIVQEVVAIQFRTKLNDISVLQSVPLDPLLYKRESLLNWVEVR
jgi:hypothetical protein